MITTSRLCAALALSLWGANASPALASPPITENLHPEVVQYYLNIDTLPSTQGNHYNSGPGITTLAHAPGPDQCHYGPSPTRAFDAQKTIRYMDQTLNDWSRNLRPVDRFNVLPDGSSEPWPSTRPLWLLSAHRGVHGKLYASEAAIPENSLQAIDEAAARLFEIVELDVHLDGNGEVVLMHDYATGRTAHNENVSYQWDPRIDPPGDGGPLITSETNGGGINGSWANYNNTGYHKGRWKVETYNPLVSTITDWSDFHLRGFNRDTGEYENDTYQNTEEVATLRSALTYVGRHYPGMVIVLDLRHIEEVTAAMDVVDMVEDCRGEPARNWVVFKPFANAHPYGRESAASHSQNLHNQTQGRWANYYWIPVVSGRLSADRASPGSPSLYLNSPGPDTSLIQVPDFTYFSDWLTPGYDHRPANIIGNEVYASADDYHDTNSMLSRLAHDFSRLNVTSWRPPDMRFNGPERRYEVRSSSGDVLKSMVFMNNTAGRLEVSKCLHGQSAPEVLSIYPPNTTVGIGFNFKDDGLGRYQVGFDNYTCLQDKMDSAQILTIDHSDSVMAAFRGETRVALLNAESYFDQKRVDLITMIRPLLTPVARFAPLPDSWDAYALKANEKDVHPQFTMDHDGVVYYGQREMFVRFFRQGQTVNCRNSTFGDPESGETKHCWIITGTSPNIHVQKIASENGSTTMANEGWVFYSTHGGITRQYYKEGDTVLCNNANFGDPAPGDHKHCWTRSITPPAGYQHCARLGESCDPTALIGIYGTGRFTLPARVEVAYGYQDSNYANLVENQHDYGNAFTCNAGTLFYMGDLTNADIDLGHCYIRRYFNREIPY